MSIDTVSTGPSPITHLIGEVPPARWSQRFTQGSASVTLRADRTELINSAVATLYAYRRTATAASRWTITLHTGVPINHTRAEVLFADGTEHDIGPRLTARSLTLHGGRAFWIPDRATVVHLDRHTSTITVHCADLEAGVHWAARLVRQAMTAQLLQHGAIYAHTAALIHRGVGVLIAGHKGTGRLHRQHDRDPAEPPRRTATSRPRRTAARPRPDRCPRIQPRAPEPNDPPRQARSGPATLAPHRRRAAPVARHADSVPRVRTAGDAGLDHAPQPLASTARSPSQHPPRHPGHPMIIGMAGVPGTGKTTLAVELAQHLRPTPLLLSKDLVRHALFGPDHTLYTREQDDFCIETILDTAAWQWRCNPATTVILDGRTWSRTSQLDRLRTFAADQQQSLLLIECVCHTAIALARLTRDHARGDHPAGNRTPSCTTSSPQPQTRSPGRNWC